MKDANESKIVVEVPNTPYPMPNAQQLTPNKLEAFKQGWVNAIALPDNFIDLAFDLTANISVPAMLTSFWVNFPLPEFVRLGVLTALIIGLGCVAYLRQVVPEVKDALLIRLGVVAVGVLLGL